MIKYTTALLSIIFGLTACSSCLKKDNININTTVDASYDSSVQEASIPEASVLPIVISGDNWQFELPSADWTLTPTEDGGPDAFYQNLKDKSLLIFLKEDFTGSTQDYTLLAIRGLKEANLKLLSSSQLLIDNKLFNYLELVNGNIKLFQILYSKNKFGYSLSCGGLDSENTFKEKCLSIFNTVRIK